MIIKGQYMGSKRVLVRIYFKFLINFNNNLLQFSPNSFIPNDTKIQYLSPYQYAADSKKKSKISKPQQKLKSDTNATKTYKFNNEYQVKGDANCQKFTTTKLPIICNMRGNIMTTSGSDCSIASNGSRKGYWGFQFRK